MTARVKSLSTMLFSNGLYKTVALLVALVLWFSIQGRKDIVAAREMPVSYIVASNMILANHVPSKVRVKVAGPRSALKKFTQMQEPITIDLALNSPGVYYISFEERFPLLPEGIKLLSISPNVVRVKLEARKN